MMIFKKAIARRTFLKGAGTALALPILDSMVPAFAGPMDTAAKPASRLSYVYVPNGRIMNKWTPQTEGAAFEITPTLEPLTAFRDRMVVISGLASREAEPRVGEPVGNHALANAVWLTGVHPKGKGQLGISVDQIAAKEMGKDTHLASLELSLDTPEIVGGGDGPDSDAYLNTLSWRSPTTPLPVENNPRAVFERLFGEGDNTDPAVRLRRIKKEHSILDAVSQQVSELIGGVGASDRAKLSEYLESVRDVEERIQRDEKQTASTKELPVLERPAGIPDTYEKYCKLMFDLQVLAHQTDMTRVITFTMAREKSERAYREIGISEGHHALSHHNGDAGMIAKVTQIDLYQSKLFAYFLEKMKATKDGDGSLLDHSTIMFGSALSDGHMHRPNNLPIVLVGGGGGLKGGRHLRFPQETPLANLHLAMLDKAGVPVDHLGDSTGKLDLLAV
jgi:hypothetical protein